MTFAPDRLPMARLGGMPCHFESLDFKGGSRLIVNSFPGRDESSEQDLGHTPKRIACNLYVCSDATETWQIKQARFLRVLDAHGVLVFFHPDLDRNFRVRIEGDWSHTVSASQIGWAKFSLTLKVVGSPLSALISNLSQLLEAGDRVRSAAGQLLVSGLAVAPFDDQVRLDLEDRVFDFLAEVQAVTESHSLENLAGRALISTVDTLAVRFDEHLSEDRAAFITPVSKLGSALSDPAAKVEVFDGFSRWGQTSLEASNDQSFNQPSLWPPIPVSLGYSPTASHYQRLQNRDVLVYAVRSAAVQSLAEALVAQAYDDKREAEEAQTLGLRAFAALRFDLGEQAPIWTDAGARYLPDAAIDALSALWREVWDARHWFSREMSSRLETLADLRAYQFSSRLPSVVVAQELRGDYRYADELAARNQVIHQGFMPRFGVYTDGPAFTAL